MRRILFDSKSPLHKTPFGTLLPEQECTLQIHVPGTVGATKVQCVIRMDNSSDDIIADMALTQCKGAYDIFSGSFSLTTPGLYFYIMEGANIFVNTYSPSPEQMESFVEALYGEIPMAGESPVDIDPGPL